MEEKQLKACEFARLKHAAANILFDGNPYTFHLNQVVNEAWDNIEELKEFYKEEDDIQNIIDTVICSCFLHDTIEDCGITYNDVKAKFGVEIADVVYNVTNELGKTRKERAEKTYPKIQEDPKSIFVKCCDRLVNTRYSKTSGSSMYEKYRREYSDFRSALKKDGMFDQLWKKLDNLNQN